MTANEIKESLRLAFGTFRAHKLRSFLTILGVLIGVFTIIAVVSLITGLNRSIEQDIESLGSNNVYVSKYKPGIVMGNRPASERNRKGITFEDAQAIQKACPAIVAVSPQNYYTRPGGNVIKYQDRDVSRPAFFGTLPDYQEVNNVVVEKGRFINDSDVKFRTMVTVVGSDVAEELFPFEDPINKVIQINDRKFTVVGVLEEKKVVTGGGENRFALIPYGTFKKIHPEEKELWLALKAESPELIPVAIDQVTELMRYRRGLKYEEPNDFAVFTQENLLEIWDQITSAVWLVMIIISSIGLLVGGVGVMNIMLVSVTERTKEIGIRKAIGARRRNILWQFLIEAMALSGFGGILGIIAGLGTGQLIGAVTPLPAAVSVPWIILAFCFSVGIALIFGIYPAARASRLDPIECLRYE
jgi:putative ABC transport system permease protein